MKRILGLLVLPVLAAFAAGVAAARPAAKGESQLAHIVMFTLKDRSAASRAEFVASCQKYLTGHEGTEYFSVGTIAEDVTEPVSDREFDVALHLIFKDKGANEAYQKSERHQKFVGVNREKFAKVRVFDSYLAPAPKS